MRSAGAGEWGSRGRVPVSRAGCPEGAGLPEQGARYPGRVLVSRAGCPKRRDAEFLGGCRAQWWALG